MTQKLYLLCQIGVFYTNRCRYPTLPLRNLLSALFEKNKLNYCDIRKFYDSDISRSEKSKSDLIYTHKKKSNCSGIKKIEDNF